MEKLGERELDIMQALWQLENATVTEVQQVLQEQGSEVAYTTVQTMLNRLEAKNLVARNDVDRAHRYYAILKKPTVVDSALKRLTERFFGGSIEALVTRLVEKDLTGEQLDHLQSLIDEHKREKGPKR